MEHTIFQIEDQRQFNDWSDRIFHHQVSHNEIYKSFVNQLSRSFDIASGDFPFLPIEFFKSHKVSVTPEKNDIIFTSSGTGGQGTSRHFVSDIQLYEDSFLVGFERFYGSPSEWTVLALLPSYLERKGSSLVYMADRLIKESQKPESGFYLDDLEGLAKTLRELDADSRKVLLIGVSFALLDLLSKGSFQLKQTVVMETGGMKGRRKEMTRLELHKVLTEGFGVTTVHSEYGMTELLSQAYSDGKGRFKCPPWMKVQIRELNDPFAEAEVGKTGGINVIDLANKNSCSFIATQDLGRLHADGTFEVLGRFDHSDLRGCNLMVE